MNDRTQQILNLAKEGNHTISEIARQVGVRRQWVSVLLKRHNVVIDKNDNQPSELSDPETFIEPDEVVALKLGIPQEQVALARKTFNIKAPFKISLPRRHRSLVKSLFGDDYLPGPNFVPFIKEQIEKLSTEHRKNLITEFYLDGKVQSISDDINTDSKRVYRVFVKEELTEIVSQFNKDVLVEQGVLIGL